VLRHGWTRLALELSAERVDHSPSSPGGRRGPHLARRGSSPVRSSRIHRNADRVLFHGMSPSFIFYAPPARA
jgi:hypothetical protein